MRGTIQTERQAEGREREREKRKKITGAVENEDQRHSSITLVESRHFSP